MPQDEGEGAVCFIIGKTSKQIADVQKLLVQGQLKNEARIDIDVRFMEGCLSTAR